LRKPKARIWCGPLTSSDHADGIIWITSLAFFAYGLLVHVGDLTSRHSQADPPRGRSALLAAVFLIAPAVGLFFLKARSAAVILMTVSLAMTLHVLTLVSTWISEKDWVLAGFDLVGTCFWLAMAWLAWRALRAAREMPHLPEEEPPEEDEFL
jgi:threonine/homoserine/homoserine lactone efflux protein